MDAADGTPEPERDPWTTARGARAERYFEHDLAGQRRWYSERASHFKSRAQALGIVVIAAGAATSFLQVFRDARWAPVLTAPLGAVVALAEGAGGRSPATARPGPPTGWPASG